MIEKFSFYIRHSLNDLRVNGQRTFFALLCIAAGVAAVVSLQTVAVMIGDSLTGNLQQSNRGDIQVSLGVANGFVSEGSSELDAAVQAGVLEQVKFTGPFAPDGVVSYRIGEGGLNQIQQWFETNYPGQVEITYPLQVADFTAVFTGGIGTTVTSAETGAAASQLTPVVVDPQVYPFYDAVTSVDGTPLSELIQSPTDIVIDEKVADVLGAKVSDIVRVNGANTDFTVRGIVPTEAEVTDPMTGLFAAIFGFYYLDHDAVQYFDGLTPQTDKFYLKVNNPDQVSEIDTAFARAFPYLDTKTVDDLRVTNLELSDRINQLVTIMGLVSLLLGSIGIINTMQVIVRRRTVEVAVLKTIGLQAGQVTILFLVEAFIMGVLGSIAGILLGWAATFVIKGVAENLVGQALPFRIALLPVVNGLIVGTLVTTIFGFLPTLAAGQVRPGVVLRPNDNIIPRAGWLRTLGAVVIIIAALSAVAYTIIGSVGLSIAVTIGAFLIAGFMILILSFLIWLIGRFFPSFGIVDLKISLRQMLATRGRGATTLLALVVGVFSLSLITLLADSLNSTLASSLGSASGGNVIIAIGNRNSIPAVENVINSLEAVTSHRVIMGYSGELTSLEHADGTVLSRTELAQHIEANSSMKEMIEAFGGDASEINVGEDELNSLGSLNAVQLDQPLPNSIREGRAFTEADTEQPVIVFTDYPWTKDAGIQIGDKVTYQFEASSEPITFEVVGLAQMPTVSGVTSGNGTFIPLDSLPESVEPGSIQMLVDIPAENVPELRRQIGTVPGTFVLETSLFTKLISSLLGTFTAFPTMVALLGLVVGGVVIANSVALTTMERRREIAVMKSVGLQRERVLGMLLLENGILGFIGGLMGVGISLLVLIILLAVGGGLVIPYGTALLLMLLCVLVALIAAGTTAWGASGEKPLNVLRYE